MYKNSCKIDSAIESALPMLCVTNSLPIPLLPPSFGRRWRVAPEVGFALFRLRPTPCPSGVPLPREGDRRSVTTLILRES